jgi:hypothetical protein
MALRRSTPTRAAIRLLGLQAADSYGRVWRHKIAHTDVFRSEAWGVEREGREADDRRSGSRLRVSTPEMLAFLKLTRRSLVLLVKAQKYIKSDSDAPVRAQKRRRKGREREIPFRTQTLIAIVGSGGRLHAVCRVPKLVREAVSRMSESSRHEFGDRLLAIARSKLARRQMKTSR